jgi:organic hydroperoxide reductase OsmC/OhrA
MSPLPTYFYETSLTWEGKRKGNATAPGLPGLPVSTPPEFNGDAGFWTPEHLFVLAAESCLMATFVAIAEKMRVGVRSYSSSARGKLEWIDGEGYRFTELEIRPAIELEQEADREKALRVVEKAEKGCLVARSITTRVTVVADIRVVQAAAE